jgi:hypothetical protein
MCCLCAAVLLTGCSDFKVKVESNTSWSGVFGETVVEGSGNREIDIADDGRACVVVQKNTVGGYLRIRIENPDDTSYQRDWDETHAAYGSVYQCK